MDESRQAATSAAEALDDSRRIVTSAAGALDDSRRIVTSTLLLVQAGVSLVSALGVFVFASLSGAGGSLSGAELMALLGAAVLVLLAALMSWRPARVAIIAWEGITLLGGVTAALIGRGTNLSLPMLLTSLVLPISVMTLVLARPGFDLRRTLTLGLLAASGAIHLLLAPAHMPGLGGLFLLFGLAAIGLALSTRWIGWWRVPAALLLGASLLAYVRLVTTGGEAVDEVGMATKLIELVALGLILMPSGTRARVRFAFAATTLLLTTTATGATAWSASARGLADGDAHHVIASASVKGQADATASASMKRDADVSQELEAATRVGIARYADVNVALADGYRPTTSVNGPRVHYANREFERDGRILDTEHPESLVYGPSSSGSVLLGALYTMERVGAQPPSGDWHTHPDLCVAVPRVMVVGLRSPFGACPVGSLNAATPAMLHVWTTPTAQAAQLVTSSKATSAAAVLTSTGPHDSAEEIDVAGSAHSFVLHVPANVQPAAPLVLAFHGLGGTGQAMQALTRMNATADEHGFIVAYPDGIDRSWHFGGSDIDDLAFVDALIDHLVATHGVDPTRVYATGMSNGGYFTTFVACARPERIAAIATVAASLAELQKLGCASAPSIRIQMIGGTEDPLVPWEGNAILASMPESAQFWVRHNELSIEPTLDEWLPDSAPRDGTRTRRMAWGDGQVEVLGVAGGGHTWPGGIQYLPTSAIGRTSRDFSASDAIWEFFAR